MHTLTDSLQPGLGKMYLCLYIFEYFCEKCKVFVFVFEYIPKVFTFMNTFMNTFENFPFCLKFSFFILVLAKPFIIALL